MNKATRNHKPKNKMTRNQFDSLCAMLYIHPSIALENDAVIEALKSGVSMDEMEQILSSEF